MYPAGGDAPGMNADGCATELGVRAARAGDRIRRSDVIMIFPWKVRSSMPNSARFWGAVADNLRPRPGSGMIKDEGRREWYRDPGAELASPALAGCPRTRPGSLRVS